MRLISQKYPRVTCYLSAQCVGWAGNHESPAISRHTVSAGPTALKNASASFSDAFARSPEAPSRASATMASFSNPMAKEQPSPGPLRRAPEEESAAGVEFRKGARATKVPRAHQYETGKNGVHGGTLQATAKRKFPCPPDASATSNTAWAATPAPSCAALASPPGLHCRRGGGGD